MSELRSRLLESSETDEPDVQNEDRGNGGL